jgi:hypothetical protein
MLAVLHLNTLGCERGSSQSRRGAINCSNKRPTGRTRLATNTRINPGPSITISITTFAILLMIAREARPDAGEMPSKRSGVYRSRERLLTCSRHGERARTLLSQWYAFRVSKMPQQDSVGSAPLLYRCCSRPCAPATSCPEQRLDSDAS